MANHSIVELAQLTANYTDSGDSAQEALTRASVGFTGKNKAYSQTNNAVIAHIENGKPYKVSWVGSATITLKKDSSSGTQVATGDTSPLSFTADSDFDLYFGSSDDVTNIMVYDARIKDSTFEPYHESVEETMYPYSANNITGAHNLMKINTDLSTQYGITFSKINDYTINLDGTIGRDEYFNFDIIRFKDYPHLFGKRVKLSAIATATNDAYTFQIFRPAGSGTPIYYLEAKNTFDSKEFTITEECLNINNSGINLQVKANKSGVQIDNITIKVMLTVADDNSQEFTDYAMTNKELTKCFMSALFSNPVMLTSSEDLDDIKTAGLYHVSSSVPVNAPTGMTNTFAAVLVLYCGNITTVTQIYIQGGLWSESKHIAIRGYGGNPGAWSAWRYITDATT